MTPYDDTCPVCFYQDGLSLIIGESFILMSCTPSWRTESRDQKKPQMPLNGTFP